MGRREREVGAKVRERDKREVERERWGRERRRGDYTIISVISVLF